MECKDSIIPHILKSPLNERSKIITLELKTNGLYTRTNQTKRNTISVVKMPPPHPNPPFPLLCDVGAAPLKSFASSHSVRFCQQRAVERHFKMKGFLFCFYCFPVFSYSVTCSSWLPRKYPWPLPACFPETFYSTPLWASSLANPDVLQFDKTLYHLVNQGPSLSNGVCVLCREETLFLSSFFFLYYSLQALEIVAGPLISIPLCRVRSSLLIADSLLLVDNSLYKNYPLQATGTISDS